MTAKPCLTCNTIHTQRGPRCRTCEQRHQQQRNARRAHYQGDWERTAKATVAHWVSVHGYWCPGYGRTAHQTVDLTCDHRTDGTLAVLCRSCNARKGQAEPVFTQR